MRLAGAPGAPPPPKVAAAFAGGGFPLALRWSSGDSAGLSRAVGVLGCAQFLDAPLLAEAARDEFAQALAHRCASAAEVAALFMAPREELPTGTQQPVNADVAALLAAAPMLGERGERFIAAWAGKESPLSALPMECVKEILGTADAWVSGDPGVSELLQALPPGVGRTAAGRDEALTLQPDEWDAAAAVVAVSRALDVVLARWGRYRRSALLTSALVLLATCERLAPEARVRAIKALTKVAGPDRYAMRALLAVLSASRDSGGTLLEGAAETGDAGKAGSESHIAAAARRLAVDAAWQVRVAACESLALIALPGDTEAVAVLVAATRHGHFEVRNAVVRALGCVAGPCDMGTNKALIRALCDDDWRVREAAAEVLASVAEGASSPLAAPSVERVTTAGAAEMLVPEIADILTHQNADVRQAAGRAIRLLAASCGVLPVAASVVRSLRQPAPGRRVPLLRRPVPEVRGAAVEVLGDVLALLAGVEDGGDGAHRRVFQETLDAIATALPDGSALVRRAAATALSRPDAKSASFPPHARACIVERTLEALAAMRSNPGVGRSSAAEALEVLRFAAERGHPGAAAAAQEVLRQPGSPAGARRAAAAAIGSLATSSQGEATRTLLSALGDSYLQEDVFRALEEISSGGAEEVRALSALPLDRSWPLELRCRALCCLSRVARRGDPAALQTAIDALASSEAGLRREALGVVVRVAEPGDLAMTALIAARLHDSDKDVQRRAMDVYAAVVQPGDTQAVADTLVAHIVGGEFCLRQMAVQTLLRVCKRGDPVLISKVLPWAETGHWPQRQAALEALAALAERGDALVVDAVLQRLADGDETCRQTACEVLSQAAPKQTPPRPRRTVEPGVL